MTTPWQQIGGGALGGLGFVGLVETVFDIRRVFAARHWAVGDGRVVQSRVQVIDAGQDEEADKLRFRYVFTVGAQAYEGTRIRAGQELDLTIVGSGWSTARCDARRYPPGTAVRVLYDPRNPKRCCLEAGGWPGILAKLVFCLALVGVGIHLAGGFFRG